MIQGPVPDFKRSKQSARKKERDLFIPAYFVEPPDLDLYAALQNLMWYAVECLNSLPSISGKNALLTEHFFKSVSLLAGMEEKILSSLDQQAKKMFLRFLDEARNAENILRGNIGNAPSAHCPDIELVPKSAAAEISAKATYLQWLAISITGEFKFPFGLTDRDADGGQ